MKSYSDFLKSKRENVAAVGFEVDDAALSPRFRNTANRRALRRPIRESANYLETQNARRRGMSKIKNPERKCRICGAKCEKQMRYCKLCAREVKEIRALRKGAYFTPKAALDVVRGQGADIVTMNPPLALSTGGYLGELLPIMKGGSK